VIACVAVAITGVVFAIVRAKASSAPLTVAFRFDAAGCALPPAAERALGGPLTSSELAAIQRVARRELVDAYLGTRLVVTSGPGAFWHVDVLQTIRGRKALADGGHSIALGPLGGIGELNFALLSLSAIRLAPAGSSRAAIVDGIGRGIGRAAVHELAHQIVAAAAMDNTTDPDSYEYASFSRASQYYGTLHWGGAWPKLRDKIGR
jgi:hypothetical protein